MPTELRQTSCGPDGEASCGARHAPMVVVSAPAGQTVWWVLAVILAVIATAVVLRRDDAQIMRSALAQSGGSEPNPLMGARAIYAFTGELTAKSYGVFMLDVDTGTIWCYEIRKGANDELQLRLVAARSWIFDRYLEEFNTAEPIPAAVRAMVEQQRLQQQGGAGGRPRATSAPASSAGN